MPGLMKMKIITVMLLLVSAVILVGALMIAGCSSANKEALIDPDTGKHSANWYTDHRASFLTDPSICYGCHGADLHGGISGVSCFSASLNGMSCHANGPSGHPAGWAVPGSHGTAAKSTPNATQGTGFSSCQICHGSNFTGGQSNRTCLNTAGCHGATVAAPHSLAPWRGGARTHTNTDTANAALCALCHLSNSNSPPGCFNSTLCHGAGGAPHAVPFTNPALHGPPAKADLTYCKGCHANPSTGGAGSNPRFNVPIGSLAAGCETSGCHSADLAHPTQWRGLTATAPGGHMTAGNMANACALCHGVGLSGGVGPACSTCHTAGSPLTLANCTSCHSSPPTGAVAPNRAGVHTVHNALTGVTGVCNTCHNGAGTGTANHDYGSGVINVSFQGTTYNAETGGPASFNAGAHTCSAVSCHGGQTTPNWLTGTIDVNTQCTSCHARGTAQYNSYNSGEHGEHSGYGCTECHDTTKLATVHFNDLNTTAMTQAHLTLLDTLNYTGTGGGTFGTCTLRCHGEEHSRERW